MCTFLAAALHLTSTGAPFLPYLITDKVVAPPQLAHCYSEKLALMPNCYFVNDYKRCHRCGVITLMCGCLLGQALGMQSAVMPNY